MVAECEDFLTANSTGEFGDSVQSISAKKILNE